MQRTDLDRGTDADLAFDHLLLPPVISKIYRVRIETRR